MPLQNTTKIKLLLTTVLAAGAPIMITPAAAQTVTIGTINPQNGRSVTGETGADGLTPNTTNGFPPFSCLNVTLPGNGFAGGTAPSVALSTATLLTAITGTASGVRSIGGTGGMGGSQIDKGCDIKVGDGGRGGNGGAVNMTLGAPGAGRAGTISVNNTGIAVVSHGGSGGAGGNGIREETTAGDGGAGGNGGAITVENHFNLKILGTGKDADGNDFSPESAFGIVVQSSGGQGGEGGNIANGAKKAKGGSGVAGGSGGAITIKNFGAITTAGGSAIGAQSIGGFGGDAGTSQKGVGGAGGFGGNGGKVTIENSAALTVGNKERGANPVGFFALAGQSVGGGGGNAGAAAGQRAIGAAGGTAGFGGAVDITNSGAIKIFGASSVGIYAQSVGGGGGSGGMAFASNSSGSSTAIGGSGGDGGSGGSVVVRNSGDICTGTDCVSTAAVNDTAGGAFGVFAQSVGGGGGLGGFAKAKSNSLVGGSAHAVGGSGGVGGAGGRIDVTNNGSITTVEIGSSAIFAQSVGGGGGAGGGSIAIAATAIGKAAAISHGGGGGGGGDGGIITVNCNAVTSGKSGFTACNPQTAATPSIAATSRIFTSGDASSGILAQSIGGGGGSGGYAVSFSASTTGALSLSYGGKGGSGGKGSEVFVSSSGLPIETSGLGSAGILAQSIGGGGGSGGTSIALGVAISSAATLAIGGSGGSGGTGGNVRVVNESKVVNGVFGSGNITTKGYGSSAILAQSIGGGGGNGGFALAGSLALNGTATSLAIGGSGGSGNNAGNVSVENYGALTTTGGGAAAIQAQSIGGGGGNGGGAISGSAAANAAIAVGVGGAGGAGGAGNAVSVLNRGTIQTKDGGNGNASAILAQSIGGGGGNGGFAVAGAFSLGAAVSAAIGGGGGNGGTASNVDIMLDGSGRTVSTKVSTKGVQSTAVVAQSIGGNGGSGGWALAGAISVLAAPAIAVGGGGGNGGRSGGVTVTSLQNIETDGFLSGGILAQSIGGSGGNGGFSAAGAFAGMAAGAVSLGGAGGRGGVANSVNVNIASSGGIITRQDQSSGIVAQSIGGNGGNGGSAFAGALSGGNPKLAIGFAIANGGAGGTGQKGAAVNVGNSGQIYTAGSMSSGIIAQSIGGSGGNGGHSVALAGADGGDGGSIALAVGGAGGSGGAGGTVTVKNSGVIATGTDASSGKVATVGGDLAIGILAQSIGGSGGNGGSAARYGTSKTPSNVGVAIGGTGGSGTLGGVVTVCANVTDASCGSEAPVSVAGGIITRGTQANAILAQSIGGGGGNGGSALSAEYSDSDYSASVAIGGSGNSGGDGNIVVVTSGGQLETKGSNSTAIIAQSIGGGGGNGGYARTQLLAPDAQALAQKGAETGASIALGGTGDSGGNASTVSLTFTNRIDTTGNNSGGILAQSIGGGGGSGGASSTSTNGGNSAELALGGSGKSGGSGGLVVLNSFGPSATITTSGSNANGVTAQSIGGGGGSAGVAFSEAAGDASAALSIGGSSSRGSNGGSVNLTFRANKTAITTTGLASFGVLAQSIGGGGGVGAISIATVSGTDGNRSATGSGTLGGKGGAGGAGGSVNYSGSADIRTSGALAAGLVAQSIGGGGGVASMSKASSSLSATTDSLSGTIALGGSNGASGIGGTVTVVASGGLIDTGGMFAPGVVAQSISGGGGLSAVKASNVTLGGKSAAASSTVNVNSGAAIRTGGESSIGIVAQSIAGGGGLGLSASTATLGGAPSGSDAGFVQVCARDANGNCDNDASFRTRGSITTNGNGSIGILAQSIGGGGGAVLGDLQGRVTFAPGIGLGRAVEIRTSNAITTTGGGAAGILAQSIGGGGGAAVSTINSSTNGDLLGILGGSINSGDRSETVTVVTYDQSISTRGANASAIVAQSIAGGGGYFTATNASASNRLSAGYLIGGLSGGGNAASVSVTTGASGVIEQISTQGANSFGVVLQSIGGGGGLVGLAVPAATGPVTPGNNVSRLGGYNNSAGGTGGSVDYRGNAAISTHGIMASGIVAQSIGGGGGIGAASNSPLASAGGSMTLSGRNGDGSTVNVTVNPSGSISTIGDFAAGVIAQSIGGGGGLSAITVGSVTLGGTRDATLSGSVNISNGSTITTTGKAAIGIVAQSIAGGGGLAIATNSATLGGGVSGSNARDVTVTSNGRISTKGVNSIGILAQSIGGGGGAVLSGGNSIAFSTVKGTGNSGKVTVNVNADITTTGAGAIGVLAQSVAGGGGMVMNGNDIQLKSGGGGGSSGLVSVNVANNVRVSSIGVGSTALKMQSTTDPELDIGEGAAVIAGMLGTAVEFDSPINVLNNRGLVQTMDIGGGMAIRSLNGDTSISNSGAVMGNLALAAGGNNLFHNLVGGSLLSGGTLDLGGTGMLRNDGLLQNMSAAPGAVQINGSLVQSSTGTLQVRLDMGSGRMDNFTTTGSAVLQGVLRPTMANLSQARAGTISLDVVSALGGVTATGLSLDAASTAIQKLSLSTVGGALKLNSTVDFSPAGLSANGQKFGATIAKIQAAGIPNFGILTAELLKVATVDALDQVYASASGTSISAIPEVATQMTTAFLETITNPIFRSFGNRGYPSNGKSWNIWGQYFGNSRTTEQSASGRGSDLSSNSRGIALGIDYTGAPNMTIGLALGSSSADFSLPRGAFGDSDAFYVGASAKRDFGAAYAAASIAYAWHDTSTQRETALMNASYNGEAKAEGLGLRLEAGYRFTTPIAQITPYAVFQLQEYDRRAYQETPGSDSPAAFAIGFDRRFVRSTRTELGASLDRVIELGANTQLAWRLRAAWAHDDTNTPDLTGSFNGQFDEGFRLAGARVVPDVALFSPGVEVRIANGLVIGTRFDAEYAARIENYSAVATLRWAW